MKIYIVTTGEYSDYHICAVFTNEEQAQIYCAVHEDDERNSTKIEEWETDEVTLKSVAPAMAKWIFYINENGTESKFLEPEKTYTYKKWNKFTRIAMGRGWRATVTTEIGMSEEQARKHMFDLFAKMMAEKNNL